MMKDLIRSRIESLPVFRWEESGESVVIYQLPGGEVEIETAMDGSPVNCELHGMILADCLKSLFREATYAAKEGN